MSPAEIVTGAVIGVAFYLSGVVLGAVTCVYFDRKREFSPTLVGVLWPISALAWAAYLILFGVIAFLEAVGEALDDWFRNIECSMRSWMSKR